MKEKRKILLCVDGSEQAMNAVRYAGGIFLPELTDVVLFHVSTEIPESFLDMAKNPESFFRSISVNDWADHVKDNINSFMRKACSAMFKAGFPGEAVKVHILPKETGVARDILKESHKNFDAVVMGRLGISNVKNILLGSVANKLVETISYTPIAIVGGSPETKKILVGFDGSKGAMKAVDCAGALMSDSECEVMLCNVIRPLGLHVGVKLLFKPEQETEWIEGNIKEIEPAFAEAKNRLVNAGFSPNRISSEILTGKASRAGAIIEKAETEGYTTIIMGRRGLNIVEEFVIGRVSTKVISMAHKMAVWIV